MIEKFLNTARGAGEALAVCNDTDEMTCAELVGQVDLLRAVFRSANRRPLVVLCALPGGPLFTAVQLAALAERVVAVPVPASTTPREARGFMQLIRPDLLIAVSTDKARLFLDAIPGPVAVLTPEILEEEPRWAAQVHRELPPQTALIQFTSGSTDAPKGILLGEQNIFSYLEKIMPSLAACSGHRVLCAVPQQHSFGWRVVLEHLLAGASVQVTENILPGEHLSKFAAAAGTAILGPPTYFQLLLRMNALDPEYLPSLRSITLGTARVDPSLVEQIREHFPDIDIHLQYGLTETAGHVTRLTLGPGELLETPGMVGKALNGVDLATAPCSDPDQGPEQIRIRSDQVAVGRLQSLERWTPLVSADGFLDTGDLGYVDAAEQLRLKGRISSFIKRNGYRINPLEIECLLDEHEGVTGAVVVGAPDELAGQRIIAVVEAADDQIAADLLAWCRQNLSAHKVPQVIHIQSVLPRTPSGKLDRQVIGKAVRDA